MRRTDNLGSVSSPLCVWKLGRLCSQTQLFQLRLMAILDNYMFRPLLATYYSMLIPHSVLSYNILLIYYTITIIYYTILHYNSAVGNIVSHIRAAVDLRNIASAIPTLTGRKQFVRRYWTALLSRGLQKARTKPTPVLISPTPWCGGIFVHEMEPSHIPSCVTTRRQLRAVLGMTNHRGGQLSQGLR